MTSPLVSICCVTYNHSFIIRKCLDGFLMQETTFPVEILVHDDASTDGTDDIVREYADKYPEKIFPLFEEQNQYSQGVLVDFFNYNRARGKYIAYCEGDDYWTDPLKLQKQVDFMEANPGYSVCWHRCKHWYAKQNRFAEDGCGFLFPNNEEGVDITVEMFFEKWVTQPLTMVFRKSDFSPEWQKMYKHYRDTYEIYHLLKKGKGYLFAFVGGVYVLHEGGISSSGVSIKERCDEEREHALELYRRNGGKELKNHLVNILLWNYDVFHNDLDMGYFYKTMRSVARKNPMIMLNVYFVIGKRKVKKLMNK